MPSWALRFIDHIKVRADAPLLDGLQYGASGTDNQVYAHLPIVSDRSTTAVRVGEYVCI
jgi:hypothetical protein